MAVQNKVEMRRRQRLEERWGWLRIMRGRSKCLGREGKRTWLAQEQVGGDEHDTGDVYTSRRRRTRRSGMLTAGE